MSEPNDHQIGGQHYKVPYEPWDFIVDWDISFLPGTAIKYLHRHEKMDQQKAIEDLRKAIHYVNKTVERGIEHVPFHRRIIHTGNLRGKSPHQHLSFEDGIARFTHDLNPATAKAIREVSLGWWDNAGRIIFDIIYEIEHPEPRGTLSKPSF